MYVEVYVFSSFAPSFYHYFEISFVKSVDHSVYFSFDLSVDISVDISVASLLTDNLEVQELVDL